MTGAPPDAAGVLDRQLDERRALVAAKVDMVDATDERTLRNFCLMAVAMTVAPDVHGLAQKQANGYLMAMAMQILHDRFRLEAGVIGALAEQLGGAMVAAIAKGTLGGTHP